MIQSEFTMSTKQIVNFNFLFNSFIRLKQNIRIKILFEDFLSTEEKIGGQSVQSSSYVKYLYTIILIGIALFLYYT